MTDIRRASPRNFKSVCFPGSLLNRMLTHCEFASIPLRRALIFELAQAGTFFAASTQ
jgi:hypothetical protein